MLQVLFSTKWMNITPQDWLKNFTYSGQSQLRGQKFYKWTSNYGGIYQNYYATQDSQRIPRRIDVGSYGADFMMNTYKKGQIKQEIFNLPNNCNKDYPTSTICGTFSENQRNQNIKKFYV